MHSVPIFDVNSIMVAKQVHLPISNKCHNTKLMNFLKQWFHHQATLWASLATLSSCRFQISVKDKDWAVFWTHFGAGVEASTNENGLFSSFWVCLVLNMKYPVNNVCISVNEWIEHIPLFCSMPCGCTTKNRKFRLEKFYCTQSGDSGTSLQDIK